MNAARAFVPTPLPPNPPLELGGACQALLERAYLACGHLDAISTLLPDPHLFLYSYIRREALLSSQIEGTQSSFSDLMLFELDETPGVPVGDVVEVANYVAALEHGLARLRDNFPLSSRLLREVHEKLLSRGRGAERHPGEFRRSQNWIGGTRPGNAHCVPAPPEEIADAMAALERFIHTRDDGLPTLVRAGVAHVQFETIHPFLDGNGRVGRLLIALMLFDAGILTQPLLYLSLYLKQRRTEYYRLLDTVRQDGDWEAWLTFFLEGVASTAQSAVETATRLRTLFDADAERVSQLGRSSVSTARVLAALRTRPLATVNTLMKATGLSFPTVARGVRALEELGVVQETTGRSRARVFVYDQYLRILNEGADPLPS